jgi:hypothetical protein
MPSNAFGAVGGLHMYKQSLITMRLDYNSQRWILFIVHFLAGDG